MRRLAVMGLVATLLAAAALAVAAGSEPSPPKKAAEDLERLEVWADRVIYHADTGKFAFTGRVIVLKGNLRVDCQQMEGTIDPKTRQFIRITAIAEVQMLTVDIPALGPDGRPVAPSALPDAWRATCSRADYDLRDGRIVMKGAEGKQRPRLWRAKGYGEADTIIFIPGKGEYELIGDPVIRGEIPTGPAGKESKPKEKP